VKVYCNDVLTATLTGIRAQAHDKLAE